MKTLDDLKREENDPNAPIEEMLRNEGWNACIDHLHAQGHLILWRDMDSAPRDGTRIRCMVHGSENILHWEPQDEEYDACWCDDDKTDWSPTAWMPLPAAPKPFEGKEGE